MELAQKNLSSTQSLQFRPINELTNRSSKSWLNETWQTLLCWYQVNVKERIIWKRREEKFYSLFGGHILFQSVAAAVEFDLFNILNKEGALSDFQIAERLKIDDQPCRILLLPLTTVGLLARTPNGLYQLTSLSRQYLLKDAMWRYSACIRWQNHINYKPLSHFYDAIKANANVGLEEHTGTEPTLYQRLAHKPELELIFQDAMEEISRQSNKYLACLPEWRNINCLVDVGGGNGTNIIAVARAWPHIQARVFDSPTVCEIAADNIGAVGLSDRLAATSGDIFTDPIPTGADCVMFCHFFTIWSREEHVMLLRKAHNALPKGGKAVVFNMMQNDARDGPYTSAIGSPYFLTLATGRGMLYCWEEYEEAFRHAGFTELKRYKLPRDHGIIVGIK